MKFSLTIVLITLLFTSFVFAQTSNAPFAALDKQIKEQTGGWNGSKENLSKIFQAERTRLSENFEIELWKYLGDDVEKHRWIALFLDSDSYLHGNQPLPELALNIREKALNILQNKDDEESLGTRFTLSVTAAVKNEKLERRELAVKYKKEAESTAKKINASSYFPAMSEYERCLYSNIGLKTTDVCEDLKNKRPERQIIAGVINSKALKLPKPKYPKQARKNKIEGAVWVKVVIDEQGNVVLAEATRGPSDLYEVSVEAARRAKFTPTLLEGKLVKVTGSVVYVFKS